MLGPNSIVRFTVLKQYFGVMHRSDCCRLIEHKTLKWVSRHCKLKKMELLDGLVDLQHMEGPGNSFQVLHDLEEPGGPVHGHEAHRFGLLRSRDVLQVSLSCGSLGASDKDDSMAMFNHQHTSLHHYHHHHHEHAFTSLPLQEAPGTIVEEEEGQAKLR